MAFPGGDRREDDHIIGEINLTPLVDIMLVLLIIFMVTSSVSLESGLDIDLPKTGGKTASKEGHGVIISLNAKGQIFVQGKQVSLEALEEEVRKALQDEATEMVILEGDRQSTLEKAIQVMDLAKRAGAKKFAIAAQETQGN